MTEREAFEKWARERAGWSVLDWNEEYYVNATLDLAWCSWQAARAQPAGVPEGFAKFPPPPSEDLERAQREYNLSRPMFPPPSEEAAKAEPVMCADPNPVHLSALDPAPAQEPEEIQGWYCPHCARPVDGEEVTYSEHHEVCGTYIGNAAPPSHPSGAQEPRGCPTPGACSCGQPADEEPVAWQWRLICPDGTPINWGHGRARRPSPAGAEAGYRTEERPLFTRPSDAFKRGAMAMQEELASACATWTAYPIAAVIADALRNWPLPEDKEG